jgi:hypothetical protein
VTQVNPVSEVGEVKTILDVAHPGFNLAKGEQLPVGKLELSRSGRSFVPGSITVTVPEWQETWTRWGDLSAYASGASSPPSIFVNESAMRDVALVKAYAKMNESSVNGGEIFTELGKTVAMLRHPFRSAGKLAQEMFQFKRQRMRKRLRTAAQAASDAWLEYRYGWRPLVLDTATIIEKAHTVMDSPAKRGLVARSSVGDRVDSTSHYTDLDGGYGRKFKGTISLSQDIRVSAGVRYNVASQTTGENLSSLFGTRPRDVPGLIWDLIPYSFVVDWFVDVGGWLEAVTPNPAITVGQSWVTTVKKSISTHTPEIQEWKAGTASYTGSLGSSTIYSDTVSRIPGPSLPFTPVLTGTTLSALHSVDAVALLCKPLLGALRRNA